jgi:hypothetical protein
LQRFWSGLLLLLALTVTLHPLSASILAANITTNTTVPDTWTYTIINNQPAGSPDYVDQFTIAISGPITVTATPAGWTDSIGLVDGVMSVTWSSNGDPTDLAPGASLGGFSIFSTTSTSVLENADVNSWDHTANGPGPNSVVMQVETPSDPVPEPWTGSTVGLSLLVGSLWLRKKSRRRTSPAIDSLLRPF